MVKAFVKNGVKTFVTGSCTINYLSGRKQRVKISSVINEWIDILTEISQGSIFGPLIFIVLINDLIMFIEKMAFAILQMIVLFINLV